MTLYVCGYVAYDGTDFHGFQYQVGIPTIQGCLEDALSKISTYHTRILGSGRTDAGVHARGQVFAVHVEWRHDIASLQRALNASLPFSIVVSRLQIAPDEFHPRFSAVERSYRYYVTVDPSKIPLRSPLTDRFSSYEHRMLDVDLMNLAAQALLGVHDFATFGQPPQGENTVRHLISASWHPIRWNLPTIGSGSLNQTAVPDNDYTALMSQTNTLVFTVTANAFLRRMVRNLVGTLLSVGRGQLSVDDVYMALQAKDRSYSSPPAPACGLVLELVTYPENLKVFV